jgi:uncharacterized protein involved in exopolysaccharide biosynthesis
MENGEFREEYSEDQINLLDYVKVILRHKKLILWIMGVVVLGTAGISLLMTPIYQAKAVIGPVTKKNEESAMSMIATQIGLAPPAATSMFEIINLLKSNVLREQLIRRYNLLPVFFDSDSLQGKSENEQIWKGLRFLKDALQVRPNQKENMVEISMEFKQPKVAADVVQEVLTELNDYMSGEAKRVAQTNQKYLESEIDRTADPFIKAKIYSLIAQQIETSMMAEAKENFAFKILDPPKIPDKKIRPKRAQMVVISFILALFVGIFAAFVLEYVKNHREELKALRKA